MTEPASDQELLPRPSLLEAAPTSFGLFALSRAFHAYGAELLLALGLHPGQELILMRLFDRDEQAQSELQRTLGLDQSTVSRALRRMQDAGLIDRRPAAHDRRTRIISLTARGEALRQPILDLWLTLEDLANDVINSTGHDSFMTTVLALEHNLAAARRAGSRARAGD